MTKLPNIEPVGMRISGQFVIGSSKKVHRTSHNRPSDSSHLGASLTPVSRVSERQIYDRASFVSVRRHLRRTCVLTRKRIPLIPGGTGGHRPRSEERRV